jgi:hypothetical protein
MICPWDAWVLGRLVCGQALNGELEAVSPRFRRVAEHLAARPPEARPDAWDAFLCGRDDRDRIIWALAAVDPEGPAPEADGFEGSEGFENEATSGWGPLRLGMLPPAQPFPLEVLPDPAARLVLEGADAIGCPPDFLGLPVLAVAGGAIGRSVSLMLKGGYFASSTIYAACVGPPSDGKTPAMKMVAAAVRRIDEALEAEQGRALERWREEASKAGPEGKKTKAPPPPKPRRIDVDDITMEALPLILADNPRGLIMIRDELTAFVLGMNQFKGGKGNDRSNALKIWSGDALKKDRVTHENNTPIRCPFPHLTILGGLPPDMLGELLDPKGRADGFLDRFLLAYPDPLPVSPWTERGVSEETADHWQALVARLWARPLNVKEGRSVPQAARFTVEGRACWTEHYNAHVREMNCADFPPSWRGPWGKFREYAGRLTLNLACLWHAADPTADPLAIPEVGPRPIHHAWTLIGYFKNHARRVHAVIGRGSGLGGGVVVKALGDWLRDGQRPSFSERDIKQARRWMEDEDLAAALKFLTERNAIRPRPGDRTRPEGGTPAVACL